MKNGSLDLAELEYLIAMALEDNVIDDNERALLRRIFGEITPDLVLAGVWERIEQIREKHDI